MAYQAYGDFDFSNISQLLPQQLPSSSPTPSGPTGGPHRLQTEGWDPKNPLCAVIITVNQGGSSYDGLFREVKQKPPQVGVSISLWEISYSHLNELAAQMRGSTEPGSSQALQDTCKEIVSDIAKAESKSVLLNFECCGGCSDKGFPVRGVCSVIKLFLDRAHLVQFGDFSTKALIHDWDTNVLGPNPLVKVGEFSSHFQLKFDPEVLSKCPSAQLVTVAGLCEATGTAEVGAMGGTVMFSVDRAKADTPLYTLEVLTVMTTADDRPVPRNDCKTKKGDRGCAGHVSITYPNKTTGASGVMIISAGHWIELSKLDTSAESIQRVIEKTYGVASAEAEEFKVNYSSRASNPVAQAAYMNSYANQFVQCQAPVSYGNISR